MFNESKGQFFLRQMIVSILLVAPLGARAANSSVVELEQMQLQWLALATDPSVFLCAETTPAKKNCDPVNDITPAGDMVLFNSLLCFSGYDISCLAVRDSQERNGRWRRSPLHIDKPVIHGRGSFSKDHVIGVLLYLVLSRDVEAAQTWLQWIKKNSNRYTPPSLRVCDKTHCILSPTLFALMYKVWKSLGLSPTHHMRLFRGAASDKLLAAAAKNLSGYELHVKGATALLLTLLGERPGSLIATIFRNQSENPFYQYLFGTKKEKIARNTLSKCETLQKDDYISENVGHQWSWERDISERAWENSMAWDCIFMANLLTASE